MKITDVAIDGFGVWTDLEAPQLSTELTVFYGPNEAGKTTLLQFVRAMFYGFTAGRKQRYLPPVQGGRPGGSITVRSLDGRYRVTRHLDHLAGDDSLVVRASDGSVHSNRVLPSLLGNIDEPTFRNVFAVGLREMQELATLADGDVARLLYDITAGLDRVSLIDVIAELHKSRERLLAAGPKNSQIADLLARREKLQHEVHDLAGLGQRYARLAAQRAEGQREIARLEADASRLEAEARLADVAAAAAGRWLERELLKEQLAALEPLGDITTGDVEQLELLARRRRACRHRTRKLRGELNGVEAKANVLGINDLLWQQAARIEALSEHEPWIAATERAVSQSQNEIVELDKKLAADKARLGLPGDLSIDKIVRINTKSVASLRAPAKALRAAKQRVTEAEAAIGDNQTAAQTLSKQLDEALAGSSQGELLQSIEKKGQLIAQLRRRRQLDDKLQQADRQHRDLESESQELLERQFLPTWMLAGLGALFVLGIGLVLGGTFLPSSVTGGAGLGLAALGLICTGGAGWTKWYLEQSVAEQFATCEKQLTRLRDQVKQMTDERDTLDRQLPKGGGPLDVRLKTAEDDLARLEGLLPLDARRQAASGQSQAARQQVQQAQDELNAARGRWKQVLAANHLPAGLSPKQAHELVARCEALGEQYCQSNKLRELNAQQRKELEGMAGRIAQLLVEAKIEPESDGLIPRLKQLRRLVAQQQELVQRRTTLRKDRRELRKQIAKLARAKRRFGNQREALFTAAGAQDEDEFRRKAARRIQADAIAKQRDLLSGEIAAVLAGHATEADIQALLDRFPGTQLDVYRDELARQRTATMDNLRKLYHDHGQATQQLHTWAEDRRIEAAQWELGVIEKQLRAALDRWQTLATTSRILEEIRRQYEQERQPQTLLEASKYLERLTGGQYRRVWTPLSERVLRVEDKLGHSLPVEVLSRGTREQLFLALRLALVHAYARRGVSLPLVLDDVLVNFDVDRAQLAAGVLREFATSGHQLLVFTCHEHIMRMFAALEAEVRRLPANHPPHQKLLPDEVAPVEVLVEKPKRRPKPLPVLEVIEVAPEPIPEPAQPLPESAPNLDFEYVLADLPPPIEPPAPPVEVPPEPRRAKRRRLDAPQELPPPENVRKKQLRFRRSVEPIHWSAEEFEGELDDRVYRRLASGEIVVEDATWQEKVTVFETVITSPNGESHAE